MFLFVFVGPDEHVILFMRNLNHSNGRGSDGRNNVSSTVSLLYIAFMRTVFCHNQIITESRLYINVDEAVYGAISFFFLFTVGSYRFIGFPPIFYGSVRLLGE